MKLRLPLTVLLGLVAVVFSACGGDGAHGGQAGDSAKLTVYSGRAEPLAGKLFEQFERDTKIDVEVRYGDSAELAATLSEEGRNSPADVFFSQDAGALGAVSGRGLLAPLPAPLLNGVDSRFRDDRGHWVGVSARARVLAYNTERVKRADLPRSVFDLTGKAWKGRIGFPPSNASFQAFVSAMRIDVGDERTRRWLEGIQANGPKLYENNIQTVEAIARGEVDVGLVNHYYLYELRRERRQIPVENHFLRSGDPGSLVNVAGVGVLKSADRADVARQFAGYLLSQAGQRYFATKTAEYPLAAGVQPSQKLRPLKDIQGPFIDLGTLGGKLPSTLQMIEKARLTN